MHFSSEEVLRYLNSLNYQYEGSEYGTVIKGLCPNPAHNDRSIGSFVIWPEGGACKCYSCGWTGDFVKFVQDVKGYSFKEAVEFLGRSDPDFAKIPSLEFKKQASRSVRNDVERTFTAPPGLPAPGKDFRISDFPYLTLRGYTENYKKEFRLYYCDRASYSFSNPKTGRTELKWLYDYMILPVGDLWEARDIKRIKSDKPKTQYPKHSAINETIFNEKNLKRNEPLYITEGAGSHPKLWTHVSTNSSFIFGANLSEAQIEILREFDSIIWIPDNDKAGLDLVFQIKANLSNSMILDIPFDDSEDEYVSCIQSSIPVEPMKYILRKHGLLYG